MSQRSLVATGGIVLVASLALAGCGSRDSGSTSTSGTATKVAKIGVIAPLSGDLSALGLGIQHSVELAVKEANDKKLIPGWTLEVTKADDEGKPDVGKNAATGLAGDEQVVGVVGNLNSSVAIQTQPVFAQAKIVQVSPANTNPALTIGPDGERLYPTYFRTCTTDAVQGPFAAQYLLSIGINKVATINDKKTYGEGLVKAFEAEFTKGGGTLVASETINADDTTKDYTSVIASVKPKGAQAVYYGGEYPQAGPCSSAFSSEASAKSPSFMPIAAISSSSEARVPEPGLPTLKRLPLKSAKLRIPASLRASTVKGSGCTENTERRSAWAPSLNCAMPLVALNSTSDCAKPRSSSPALMVLMLNTEPPVDSTEQRMPCLARSLLTRRQIAPPAA